MKPHTPISSVFIIAITAALAVWVAVAHAGRLRLAEENQALDQELAHMTELLDRNRQLAESAANPSRSAADEPSPELLHLRGEVSLLRQQARGLEAVREETRAARAAVESAATTNRTAGATATADYWPRDSWAFSGYASPDAALQTSLWAANNGDLKAVFASTTGKFHQMIEEELAGKSDTEASIRVMDEVLSLTSVRILNREAVADDTVMLTVAFEARGETHTGQHLLKKIGSEWKLAE